MKFDVLFSCKLDGLLLSRLSALFAPDEVRDVTPGCLRQESVQRDSPGHFKSRGLSAVIQKRVRDAIVGKVNVGLRKFPRDLLCEPLKQEPSKLLRGNPVPIQKSLVNYE